MNHGTHCPMPLRGACLLYSTDGTKLGADIAHTMGTDDEDLILAEGLESLRRVELDGMDAEQRDWEMAE